MKLNIPALRATRLGGREELRRPYSRLAMSSTRAAQAFHEQGGLAPGTVIEYLFVSHALLPHYHEERSVPLSLP